MMIRFLPSAFMGCLVACLLIALAAGCSSKVEDGGKPKTAVDTKGGSRPEDSSTKLTKDYFPITIGQERASVLRRYTRKDYKSPRPEIVVKEEKRIGVWTKPNTTEVKIYGGDCQVWRSDREPKSPTGPSRQVYRKTDRGIEIGHTYGTANPKHPGAGLTYWVAFLKWDTKPGDSWKTEVAVLKRTFTATFEKSVVMDGKQCASIVIVEDNRDDNLFHLERYWLMYGVGLVKAERFGCDPRYYKELAETWMPESDRAFGEWKGDTQPLTFQERQP